MRARAAMGSSGEPGASARSTARRASLRPAVRRAARSASIPKSSSAVPGAGGGVGTGPRARVCRAQVRSRSGPAAQASRSWSPVRAPTAVGASSLSRSAVRAWPPPSPTRRAWTPGCAPSAPGRARLRRGRRAAPAPGVRGGSPGGEQCLPGRVDGGGRGVPGAVPGVVRVRGGSGQGSGGRAPLRTLPAQQRGPDGDQPRDRARGRGQRQVSGHLAEVLRGEECGRGDEGEDHRSGRPDAGGVAEHLLPGREKRADGDQHGGRVGE